MSDLGRTKMRDFDYDLPSELIAQEPLEDRSDSRLIVLPRDFGAPQHHSFRDLPDLLAAGDLLVVNDTRVNPARLIGKRETGAMVEVLLLRELGAGTWQAIIRPWRRLRDHERVTIPSKAGGAASSVTIIEKRAEGGAIVKLDPAIQESPGEYGRVPLPPYITHHLDDEERYQTVYAERSGSAAAPTAGLHFTPQILGQLAAQGVDIASVTLHVGLDTFRPVTAEFAEEHTIHTEWCRVPEETITAIRDSRARGGRVIAVGTTTARTLEAFGQCWDGCSTTAFEGMTDIFITPGYAWKVVDGLMTNFHLPRSTLLLMVSALVGRERLLAAYQEAIDRRYRFFSFGDAMLVLPGEVTRLGFLK